MVAAGVEPLAPYPGARELWPCRCTSCGRDVTPRYDAVKRGISSGCRWCAVGRRATTRRQGSKEAALVLAAERGLEPLDPYPGATAPWRCRCLRCGAEASPTYHNLKVSGGCRACGIVVRATKQRGPADVAVADLAAAGFDPLEEFPGVMNPWRCQCRTCGKTVSKTMNDIRSGRPGCRWCLRLIVDPDEAAEFMRSVGVEPLVPYPGSEKPWRCRCRRCHREVRPLYGPVRGGACGPCGYCGKRVVEPNEAAELMRTAQLEPLEPYPGSPIPWKCRCLKCGRTVKPTHSNIKQGVGGCRWCQGSGFKAAEVAVVYLIVHPLHGAAKIGITDTSGTRLKLHRSRGWQTLAIVQVPGEQALDIEKDVLSWWRADLELPPYLSKFEMPQGGWTETVDVDEIDIPATIARMRDLASREAPQVSA